MPAPVVALGSLHFARSRTVKTVFVLAAFALAAAMSNGKIAYAQAPAVQESPALRYAAGLAQERHGDDTGAFIAFVEAAEAGYPPAQRKLGEIYDSGNKVVKRNFQASIRWYEKAREGGEVIPSPPSPMPNPAYTNKR
jgi:TPR repeat protein